MARPCTHKTRDDHSVGRDNDGNLLWKCSNCLGIGRWTKSWGYFGNVECKRCWAATMDVVWCCTRCRKALEQKGEIKL